ncbi:MAG: hypothetical protein K8R88_06005 [Armatimonadetes bacterium]|nr:hypothetical protein [Armatimonadota bacterium]
MIFGRISVREEVVVRAELGVGESCVGIAARAEREARSPDSAGVVEGSQGDEVPWKGRQNHPDPDRVSRNSGGWRGSLNLPRH